MFEVVFISNKIREAHIDHDEIGRTLTFNMKCMHGDNLARHFQRSYGLCVKFFLSNTDLRSVMEFFSSEFYTKTEIHVLILCLLRPFSH